MSSLSNATDGFAVQRLRRSPWSDSHTPPIHDHEMRLRPGLLVHLRISSSDAIRPRALHLLEIPERLHVRRNRGIRAASRPSPVAIMSTLTPPRGRYSFWNRFSARSGSSPSLVISGRSRCPCRTRCGRSRPRPRMQVGLAKISVLGISVRPRRSPAACHETCDHKAGSGRGSPRRDQLAGGVVRSIRVRPASSAATDVAPRDEAAPVPS